MVMCRPGLESQTNKNASTGGGPVFVPRRQPSPLAEDLLAELRQSTTPRDESGFAGRPVS